MTQRSRQVHRGIACGGRDQRGSVAEDRGQRAESEGRGRKSRSSRVDVEVIFGGHNLPKASGVSPSLWGPNGGIFLVGHMARRWWTQGSGQINLNLQTQLHHACLFHLTSSLSSPFRLFPARHNPKHHSYVATARLSRCDVQVAGG